MKLDTKEGILSQWIHTVESTKRLRPSSGGQTGRQGDHHRA